MSGSTHSGTLESIPTRRFGDETDPDLTPAPGRNLQIDIGSQNPKSVPDILTGQSDFHHVPGPYPDLRRDEFETLGFDPDLDDRLISSRQAWTRMGYPQDNGKEQHRRSLQRQLQNHHPMPRFQRFKARTTLLLLPMML
jgi:hypothetical protein